MTPDLMEEGAQRFQDKLAPEATGQTESGGQIGRASCRERV